MTPRSIRNPQEVTPIWKGDLVGKARTRAKRQKKQKQAAIARDEALYRASYRCEFEDSDGRCTERRNLHCHHIKRRSQGGGDEASNYLVCCSAHHLFIHEYPAWSRREGYLK